MAQEPGRLSRILWGAAGLAGLAAACGASLAALLSLTLLLPVRAGGFAFYAAVFLSAVLAGLTRRLWRPEAGALGTFFSRLGFLLAASWLAVAAVHGVVHRRFDRFREGLKSRGLPVGLADFAESLPDARYGEAAYEAAFAKLDPRLSWSDDAHPGLQPGRWTAETARKEEPAVRALEPILLKELAPLSGRFTRYKKVDYAAAARRPFETPLPRFAGTRAVRGALKLCALWRAWRGDREKAWGHVRTLLDIGDLIATERSLLAKAVAGGFRRTAAETRLQIRQDFPGVAMPKELAARFARAAAERPMSEGLKGEFAAMLEMRDAFEREPGLAGEAFGGGNRIAGALARLFVSMGLMDVNIQVSADHVARIALVDDLGVLPESRQEEDRIEALPLWPCLFARMATPKFSGLLEKQAEMQALLRQAAGG